jgi:hypothetical protein
MLRRPVESGLRAAVGVQDGLANWWTSAPARHVERGDDEWGAQVVAMDQRTTRRQKTSRTKAQ